MSGCLGDSLGAARAQLSEIMPPHEAEREARLILCHALDLRSAQLLSRLDQAWPVDGAQQRRFLDALSARRNRQPLSQILGTWDFYGRPFRVTSDTLTPRPDTETLVELALAEPFSRLLDLGTGTGAIAITLLAERPEVTGLATDISAAALDVAHHNAQAAGVAERLTLTQADWFAGVDGAFDLIVSNPPYVDAATYGTLQPEVTQWEPSIALTPGGDGLSAYRVIAAQAPAHLSPGGRLIVEIGYDQGVAVARLMSAAGLADVRLHADLSGKDRVICATSP